MSMEKALLLAKTPAMQELFEDYKHVLYYQPSNPASLKKKLVELNSNINLRNKLAENGRKIVEEKYNSQNMAKHINLILKRL